MYFKNALSGLKFTECRKLQLRFLSKPNFSGVHAPGPPN